MIRTGPERHGVPFMDIYSAACRWHMDTYGTTQKQLAVIASKNHFHSSLNPNAQFQKDMSVAEVLAGAAGQLAPDHTYVRARGRRRRCRDCLFRSVHETPVIQTPRSGLSHPCLGPEPTGESMKST